MPNRNFDCVDVVLLPHIMQTIELNFLLDYDNYNDGGFL